MQVLTFYSRNSLIWIFHQNFVFDKREAISAGDKDGDGGVVKKKGKKGKEKEPTKDDLPAKCCVCEKKWDRYIGKKKCYTCGVPGKNCNAFYSFYGSQYYIFLNLIFF